MKLLASGQIQLKLSEEDKALMINSLATVLHRINLYDHQLIAVHEALERLGKENVKLMKSHLALFRDLGYGYLDEDSRTYFDAIMLTNLKSTKLLTP